MAAALLASCEEPAAPTFPPSVSFIELFEFYQQEKENNPTRLKNRVEAEELRVFNGPISNIDGSKIQFHVQRIIGGRDRYVECEFSTERSVLSLNVGDQVTVYGNLDDVNSVVRFKGCGFRGGSAP